MKPVFFSVAALFFFNVCLFAQNKKDDPKATEVWSPEPAIVTAGKTQAEPPSDAIILFSGKNFDEWVFSRDTTKTAAWTINGDAFTVKKGTGNIQTKRKFTDYQLHLEWMIPVGISGEGQSRGNSGLFLASTGPGDLGYEIQILDCYNNKTYVNGQVGSVYKQSIPLVNASKQPGEWQTYDVIWTAPRFDETGKLVSAARVTVLHNGVLLQNNTEIKGNTVYIGKPFYKAHGAASIKLQDHGDPSQPISFRNIWVRLL